MAFKVGDAVRLGPNNNGSSAFKALSSGGQPYLVEALGSSCSRCQIAGVPGASLRILGHFYCEQSFVLVNSSSGAQAAATPPMRKDPARDLYKGEVDWHDTLPDPTAEEYQTLPTREEIDKRDREKWKKYMETHS